MNNLERKIEQLEKYIEVREQEIDELQERIDKAIKIIEKNENKAPIEVILNDIGEALKVLKGSDNNE